MHEADGRAGACGWVRREGSVEEHPGRELTGEVERERQRDTFACDALTVRCRGQLPPHARHHYICSRTRRLNLELRARRAPEAEAHLASSTAAVRPTAARSGDMRSVETRGIECVTPPAKGYQF